MGWTWAEIESDWLAGSVLAERPDVVIAAFDRVTEMFGREWVMRSRIPEVGGETRGSGPTLAVVRMGQLLSVVARLPGSAGLVARLAQRRADAYAEATALYLLLRERDSAEAEVEPTVPVGARDRKPDARVRRPADPWTYLEVARPESSDAHKRVATKAKRLVARALQPTLVPFALEIFLRREPTDDELLVLEHFVRDASRHDGRRESIDLPSGLGTIFLNFTSPMQVILEDHEEAYTPRIGVMQGRSGGEEFPRHVVARIPFSDDRADEFLRSEARQLPREGPGVIMLGTSAATGAIKSWEAVLKRRFQPHQYTRVSAICLFQGGQESTDAGEALVPHTKLIVNPYAREPLAPWVEESLRRYESV